VIENLLQEAIASYELSCVLRLLSQEPGDPRELPEIPEVRLWFIVWIPYPWLPFLLDWKAGELARYTAMLVPHQFSSKRRHPIQSRSIGDFFDAEALCLN